MIPPPPLCSLHCLERMKEEWMTDWPAPWRNESIRSCRKAPTVTHTPPRNAQSAAAIHISAFRKPHARLLLERQQSCVLFSLLSYSTLLMRMNTNINRPYTLSYSLSPKMNSSSIKESNCQHIASFILIIITLLKLYSEYLLNINNDYLQIIMNTLV